MKKHIIFDLHNTLIHKKYAYYELLEQILSEYKVKHLLESLPNENFDKGIYQKIFSFPPEHFNNSQSCDSWVSIFTEAIDNLGISMILSTKILGSEIYHRLSESSNWNIFEDVEETFAYLRDNKISFGFLSNWDNRMAILWKKLSEELNVRNELALFSYQVGYCKPNPMFFKTYIDLVSQRYGHIDKFIKVGDDINTDNGGVGLGVYFLHIDRRKKDFNLLSEIKQMIQL